MRKFVKILKICKNNQHVKIKKRAVGWKSLNTSDIDTNS